MSTDRPAALRCVPRAHEMEEIDMVVGSDDSPRPKWIIIRVDEIPWQKKQKLSIGKMCLGSQRAHVYWWCD